MVSEDLGIEIIIEEEDEEEVHAFDNFCASLDKVDKNTKRIYDNVLNNTLSTR